jgi:hypothetical protein
MTRSIACFPPELGARLGLVADASGAVAWQGVADLIRQAVGRWSLVRRAAVRRFVESNLAAVVMNDEVSLDRVGVAIERLCELGEIEAVVVGEPVPMSEVVDSPLEAASAAPGTYVAATLSRYLCCNERILLCGASEPLPLAFEWFGDADEAVSIARWARAGDAMVAQLEDLGFRQMEVEDWFGAPGWLDYIERRRAGSGGQLYGLGEILKEGLEEFGAPVSDAARYALIGGTPGEFFGRPERRDGRWRPGDVAPDGTWCGVVKGYGERHLRPVVVEAKGGRVVRSLDLFDFDELRWALLARGCTDRYEVIRVVEGGLEMTFPWPSQWRRVAALCRTEGWRWMLPPWINPKDVRRWLPGAVMK